MLLSSILIPFLIHHFKLFAVRLVCRKVSDEVIEAFLVHYLGIPEETAPHIAKLVTEAVEKSAELLHELLSSSG